MSSRQRKRERHEVLAAEKAPPSFLDWSEDAIMFSREDHPNRIPNPGQYPLVVDPVIGNARFSKVLTPKIGTGERLICGPNVVTNPVQRGEDFFRRFGRDACGRQFVSVRQKDCLR
jgi:hypothetical protein